MTRFALPRGRWRYLLPGALAVTAFFSQRVLPPVLAMSDDLGVLTPLSVRAVASPWWAAGCLGVAMLGVVAAGALGPRRAARVLVSTTVLSLVSGILTVSATLSLALPFACLPLLSTCCYAGPIR